MTVTGDRPSAAAWRNLLVATAGFALTFWAWNLIAPLAADFDDRLHMGASAQSLRSRSRCRSARSAGCRSAR